jgi:NAD(P)-dependent dehydrogenase (short-subunit alcohol dehydrogenase family)
VALVIGGGSGIGRGIALGLAREDMSVAIADLNEQSAEAVAEEIRASGGLAKAYGLDATKSSPLSDLAVAVSDEFGVPSVLSWNVGVTLDQGVLSTTEVEWQWILNINLMSAILTVNTFAPSMAEAHEYSTIVLTGSMASLVIPSGKEARERRLGAYATSKHALLGYAAALHEEMGPDGVHVAIMCPGRVQSNLYVNSATYHPFDESLPKNIAEMQADTSAMPAEFAGELAVAGMKAGRFYLLTHPASKKRLLEREATLMSDLAFAEDTISSLRTSQ